MQLHGLEDAVGTWRERYRQRTWVRQLDGEVTQAQEDELLTTIAAYDGRPFPTTPGLARQWLKGRWKRTPTALETIYCAELVATTYLAMGLLPGHRPAGWYDPGRFWSGDGVELAAPFGLGGELAVG